MTHSRKAKPLEVYPPEIRQLIAKHGGNVSAATKAAGLANGTFGKISLGKRNFTNEIKLRVENALKGIPTMAAPKAIIPAACPPLLARLLGKLGSKQNAKGFLGVGDTSLSKMMAGSLEPTAAQIIKMKAELGESVIGAPVDAPAVEASKGPEFVQWDGKAVGTYQVKAHGNGKARVLKTVPKPLADFMATQKNVSKAAGMLGVTGGTLLKWMEGETVFDVEKQRRVHAVVNGNPPSAAGSMGEEFDKYTMDLAIVFTKGTNYDRIADIADILYAKMVFRKNTQAGWILMYSMATEDLRKFKRLALRDALEIVCP